MVKLNDHITHKSGKKKTVCVTVVLTALGVDLNAFHYTNVYADILRRNGFAVRSRKSAVGKNATIGSCRAKLAQISREEPQITAYVAHVVYGRSAHLILLDAEGKTIVDTAPRTRDKRRVYKIYAVWKKR